MARKPNVFPSYLHHKSSGQARVRIDGHDILIGPYGSEQSRIRYGELIAKLAGGIPIDPLADSNRGKVPRNESEVDSGPTVGENQCCLSETRGDALLQERTPDQSAGSCQRRDSSAE